MRHSRRRKIKRELTAWIISVAVSAIYILAGFKLATAEKVVFNTDDAYVCKAVVSETGKSSTDSFEIPEGESDLENTTQYFTAEILNGEFKGKTVLAAQMSDNFTLGIKIKPVKKGDKVILYNYGVKQGDADWIFADYSRLSGVVWLIAAYCVLMLVLGRLKGFKTLVSLGFTILAVFAVFVPSILSGSNIYLQTAITCVYVIAMTMLITGGLSEKSFTTMIGCSFGVAVAAVLASAMDKLLGLTGMIDEHTVYLTQINPDKPISLNAIIFSMIVIGALGAVMDVAMDISSSLYEIHDKAPQLRFSELFKSGITIGRDIMGTMANTLVLAYIGSSLGTILLLIYYSSSLYELLNREGIIVEMLNAFIGSLAIVLTIPLTSLVCAAFYTKVFGKKHRIGYGMDEDALKKIK